MLLGSESSVLVLHRSPSPVPSIQMYMAWTLSPWGSSMYCCLTALLKLALADVAILFATIIHLRMKRGRWEQVRDCAALWITCCITGFGAQKNPPHTQKQPHCFVFSSRKGGGEKKNRPLKKAHFQRFPIFSALATKEKATLHHPCLLIRLHLTPQMPPHSVENTRKQTASAKHTSSIHAVADRRKQVRQCYIICFLFHTHYLLTYT